MKFKLVGMMFVLGCTQQAQVAPPDGLDLDGSADASADSLLYSPPAPLMTEETFGIGIVHMDGPMPNDLMTPGPVAARIWDTSYATSSLQWSAINKCNVVGGCAAHPEQSTFVFDDLDTYLATLSQYGYKDALYTISRTPPWASQRGSRCLGPGNPDATCTAAADIYCDYADGPANQGRGAGQCETNVDLHPDGKGSNATWRNWVYKLVTHLKSLDPAHYAHVAYYEIWNEAYRSQTLWQSAECGPGDVSCAFNGTWAQLLRMAQDARCIIIGNASDPITAIGKTCGTDFSPAMIGLDPTAKIVSPSAGASQPRNRAFAQNFFYCNGTGTVKPTSDCSWNVASRFGANAVDVVNTHGYYHNGTPPEKIAPNIKLIRDSLQPDELAKPFFLDEGNGDWVDSTTHTITYDPELAEASIPRYYLAQRNEGVSRLYWYNAGAPLWYAKGDFGCNQNGGCLAKPGTGFSTSIAWLAGKGVYPKCQIAGNTWECDLRSADPNYRGMVVWDLGACKSTGTLPAGCDSTKSFIGCTFASDCTTSPFDLPALPYGSWSTWRDLDTDSAHAITGQTVPIGIKPILIEGTVTGQSQ